MMWNNRNVINVLGTSYTISTQNKGATGDLQYCDGYCDYTSKRIVIADRYPDFELESWTSYQNKVLRHEIIHAFLNESGIEENYEHAKRWGHDETMVDWLAIQFPKIQKVFKQLGIEEEEE